MILKVAASVYTLFNAFITSRSLFQISNAILSYFHRYFVSSWIVIYIIWICIVFKPLSDQFSVANPLPKLVNEETSSPSNAMRVINCFRLWKPEELLPVSHWVLMAMPLYCLCRPKAFNIHYYGKFHTRLPAKNCTILYLNFIIL